MIDHLIAVGIGLVAFVVSFFIMFRIVFGAPKKDERSELEKDLPADH